MDTFADDPLVQSVAAYVKDFMQNYDASHDWNHIQRVVGLARYIYSKSENQADLDLRIIHLAALLHDVGDHKYLPPSAASDPTPITTLLLSLSCPPSLAVTLQTICLGVSFSSEVKDPARVAALVARHPELAVVQDADRLDALGAVGLARMFTFGGAKGARDLQGSVDHVDEKLVKLEDMCKTEVGRGLARERTERLRLFQGWWTEEVGFATAVQGK
ncbi:hypothetical protein B0T25DRAFT_515538 [Lasiosphaeria hispida]|uniref:HD/PDEase domain-containing protein n=1 Tax=Lasiosphaeria hispida TaxID=260671 RepID=A0AAJ0HRN7_9PEZI|nr:hypothetical protein B0T25DRAFT_515538 [Lasiosphaeria hispida]